MTISYDSIGQVCVTAINGSYLEVNEPCKFGSGNGITACSEDGEFNGVVVATRDNYATVAVRGFVTLPYSGTAPTVGYCPLAFAAAGKVQKLDDAQTYLVVHVDSINSNVTFLL